MPRVLLGADDCQTIRWASAPRIQYAVDAAYKAQVTHSGHTCGGGPIYWISIPPMGDAYYQAAMQEIANPEGTGKVLSSTFTAFLVQMATH
jgi:hypothetical protein